MRRLRATTRGRERSSGDSSDAQVNASDAQETANDAQVNASDNAYTHYPKGSDDEKNASPDKREWK